MAALQVALSSDVDEIELDFRGSHDGKLVASHLDLYFDTRGVPRFVSRGDLLDHQRHGLMSLDDCLRIFSERGQGKKLRIELKSKGAEQHVVDAVTSRGLADRVVLVSWSVGTLRRLREIAPSVELSLSYIMGLQGSGSIPFAWPTAIPSAIHDASLNIRSVNVIGGCMGITPRYVSKLLSCGIEVFVLSRGGEVELKRLRALGVTGALFSSVEWMSTKVDSQHAVTEG